MDSMRSQEVDMAEVERLSALKSSQVIKDEARWRQTIRDQMEMELDQRVREALETPPEERLRRRRQQQALKEQQRQEVISMNSHQLLQLSDRERQNLKRLRRQLLQTHKETVTSYFPAPAEMEFIFRDKLSKSNQDEFPGVFGLDRFSEGLGNIPADYFSGPGIADSSKLFNTKDGFLKSVKTGNLPSGVQVVDASGGYADKNGVLRDLNGPFWPMGCVPLFPAPRFKWWSKVPLERLYFTQDLGNIRTVDSQCTPYLGRFRGTQIVYDSERCPREFSPQFVSEGCCPNLVFESRFESGNLRQARRIGQFEYELVLKTDLYTARHTQWYFFRIQNAQPNITYKFRIINLLKRDSLYNYGMQPLMYSENDAAEKQLGWVRTGHHISYSRNFTNTSSPLLQKGIPYYMLEWQMEFPNADDTYYLAHCYPYTFTDLKDDLDTLLASPERKSCIRCEVLCETRAGNSCFLVTVTNFDSCQASKKAVVVTARVHPGESQSSWMMKGFLEFVTGADRVAQELRNKFVFKVVPMLNPDGVIVGNYRCSLAARDLNRNYRHPRPENFPTIYNLKSMVEKLSQHHEVMLYCDLHGHSRKHNVFMYGNNTSTDENSTGIGAARAYINERLFPWLMSVKCPDKFAFKSCKFHVRKCKESTGRVVMWRQMNIYNSFTLEATFSGTITNKENRRHFNTDDLMKIGESLAHVILDYQHVQENKIRQTEVVLELTKVITQQILESRGLMAPLPDFLPTAGSLRETDVHAVQEDAENWTGAMMTLLQKPGTQIISEDDKVRKEDRNKKWSGNCVGLSKEEAGRLLDKASLCTLDGCLNMLATLDIREAFQESDSSDSDSESEPEMKPPEVKNRKKKRKSRKLRNKENAGRKQNHTEKKIEEGSKELHYKTYSVLPALTSAEPGGVNSSSHSLSRSAISESSSVLTSAQFAKKQESSSYFLDRYNKAVPTFQFQSKYEGRHNGGVPCFTEERSIERAAKRLAERRRKNEEDKQDGFDIDENGTCPYPNHTSQMYPGILTQEDFSQQLRVAFSEGTSSLPKTNLGGLNIKTGYTHAGNLQELYTVKSGCNTLMNSCISDSTSRPSNIVGNGENSSTFSINLRRQIPHFAPSHPHALSGNKDYTSSSEKSDSDDELPKLQSTVPLSSLRSPYHQDMVQHVPHPATWSMKASQVPAGHLSAILHPPSVAKRHIRYKTSSQRQSISHNNPPVIVSGIQPVVRTSTHHHNNHRFSPLSTLKDDQAHTSLMKMQGLDRQGYIWE